MHIRCIPPLQLLRMQRIKDKGYKQLNARLQSELTAVRASETALQLQSATHTRQAQALAATGHAYKVQVLTEPTRTAHTYICHERPIYDVVAYGRHMFVRM
jgi:hypothetical protein